MSRWVLMSALTAGLAGAVACDAESEVQRQTRELQAAQKHVGKETKRLEEELGRAQADVARLEQKLLLARQGLTDEVLENQKQLEEALKAQDQKVREELNHAQREAQNHTRDTEAALKQLGQTPPPATSAPTATPTAAASGAAPAPARDELRREELLAVRGGPELGEGVDAGEDDVPPEAPSSTPPAAHPSAEPAPGQQPAPPPAATPPAATPPAAAPPAPAPYGPPPPPAPPMQ